MTSAFAGIDGILIVITVVLLLLLRSLVVAALVHDIGRGVWWPWRKRISHD
ncbi:MAG: hypothetical protein ACTMKZ_13730 [Brevibacterium aurantiacum]|uniref:Uncharacterized protein n=1 Tax=Brevibacterium aurantiacum TaxID=273384 RepID=A0A2H1JUY4_BREAU|nr:hypothetical protein [Brevibacterium aurantiacum]SMX91114.1 hypothetical protein BAUR920_02490 [Brevibacterium aurantiacum]